MLTESEECKPSSNISYFQQMLMDSLMALHFALSPHLFVNITTLMNRAMGGTMDLAAISVFINVATDDIYWLNFC